MIIKALENIETHKVKKAIFKTFEASQRLCILTAKQIIKKNALKLVNNSTQ